MRNAAILQLARDIAVKHDLRISAMIDIEEALMEVNSSKVAQERVAVNRAVSRIGYILNTDFGNQREEVYSIIAAAIHEATSNDTN